MLLVGFMRTKRAKEIRKQLRREYFAMREVIKSDEQLKAQLLLSIYNGGQEGIVASKQLTEMEVQENFMKDQRLEKIFQHGFEEDVDYVVFTENGEKGGRPRKEYVLKIDMAKEIANWIEHNQVARMIELVDEDEKLKCLIGTSGQNREMCFSDEESLNLAKGLGFISSLY